MNAGEHGLQVLGLGEHAFTGRVRIDLRRHPQPLDPRKRRKMLVAVPARDLQRFVGRVARAVEVVALVARVGQVYEERATAQVVRLEQPGRPRQQARGGSRVVAGPRPSRGGCQPLARAGAELERTPFRDAQLPEVTVRLLEMVAGEPLVEIGPRLLGKRVVRGVADEDVPEPKCVVAAKLRLFRSHELLAHETEQTGRDLRILRSQRLHGRAVEDLPLDRAALERGALACRKLIEARREQRLRRCPRRPRRC